MQAGLERSQARVQPLGIAAPLRFAPAWSDGAHLPAFRCSGDDRPPTLCVGGSAWGSTVAAEPLNVHPEQWRATPANKRVMGR